MNRLTRTLSFVCSFIGLVVVWAFSEMMDTWRANRAGVAKDDPERRVDTI